MKKTFKKIIIYAIICVMMIGMMPQLSLALELDSQQTELQPIEDIVIDDTSEYTDDSDFILYEDYCDFDEPYIEDEQASASVAETTEADPDEGKMEITLDCYDVVSELYADPSGTDFVDMFLTKNSGVYSYPFALDTDSANGYYYVLQSSCYDGEQYYYFAFVVKDIDKKNVQTRIVKATFNGEKFVFVSQLMADYSVLHHANDMVYKTNTDKLIIVCADTGYSDTLCILEASKFPESGTSTITESDVICKNVSCMITSFDYNAVRNQYVVGVKGNQTKKFSDEKPEGYYKLSSLNYYVILDSDLNIIDKLNDRTDYIIDNNWVRQTVVCDEHYIYALHSKITFDNNKDVKRDEVQENRIRVYDWEGNIIRTVYFNTPKSTERLYEVETMLVTEGHILLMFNNITGQKNRQFCYYDLMANSFQVRYTSEYGVNMIESDMSFVIRDVPTRLQKSRFFYKDHEFLGWHAYRVEKDKWYYESADGATRAWYKEGSEPDGYTKYLYSDEQRVSRTGAAGETVIMHAQWSDTITTYNISYHSNGGTGTMADSKVVYGTATALSENTFKKTDREFQGWHAYWEEYNKWLYESADATDTGWYVEGKEPAGYKKYICVDKRSVAKTAYAGSNIQMHALWDEFTIYYNANKEIIRPFGVKDAQVAHYKSGDTNTILPYTSDQVYRLDKTTAVFKGYHLYRKEVGKWYYENSDKTEFGWYASGSQPEGFKKHLKVFKDGVAKLGGTARPGEHLIMYAIWQ